jgi:receptor protein-tyrosine kinase
VSIIEQAAKRLSELKESGIEIAVHPPLVPTVAEIAAPAVEEAGAVSPNGATISSTAVENGPRSRRVDIDFIRLQALGYMTPDAARSKLADEFRVVKRPLLQNAQVSSPTAVRRGNLVMVTSSVPGEGKTFAAINLAMSIAAERDTRVLLVDADTARPSVMERLGLRSAAGLIDILQIDQPDLSQFMLRTNVDKLTLLPAGSRHNHATELLASENMRRLLDDLATRYPDRMIVFDAPPLLPAPEARVLASRMGQILFVVGADETTQGAVSEALGTLESCPVVLTLLNKARITAAEGYYGYYGYGYGYGR